MPAVGGAQTPPTGSEARAATALAPVEVGVTTWPAQPKAGETVKLTLEMRSAGARLSRFDVAHERELRLLMVTPDLTWFAHVHPEPQADGTFVLEQTFPDGGTYRPFSDFKATGRAAVVRCADLAVDGARPPRTPLVASDLSEPRRAGDYEVRLTPNHTAHRH